MTTEIKPAVRVLADQFKAGIKIPKIERDNTEVELQFADDAWHNTLPEGMTVGQVSAVHNHHTNTMAAGKLAVGEVGIEVMSKHKAVERVTGTLKLADKDTMSFGVNRQNEGRNPRDGSVTTSYGRASASFDLYGAANRGENKKVSAHLGELGEKALAPKK